MATTKRKRRTPEQMIQDLQAEIERIREAEKAKSSPARKAAKAALRSLAKAKDLAAEEGESDLVAAVDRAIAALSDGAGETSPAGGRIRRTQEEIEELSAGIWDTLAEQPGMSISDLAAALEMTSKEVRGPLKAMLEAGQVRKKGERRGTQYFTKGRRPF